MSKADIIFEEAKTLPERLQDETLDFIGFLKSRTVSQNLQSPAELSKKVGELENFFSRFQIDTEGFRFNREEANER